MPAHYGKHNKAPNWGGGSQAAEADGKYANDEGMGEATTLGADNDPGNCGGEEASSAIYDRPVGHVVGTRSTEKASG